MCRHRLPWPRRYLVWRTAKSPQKKYIIGVDLLSLVGATRIAHDLALVGECQQRLRQKNSIAGSKWSTYTHLVRTMQRYYIDVPWQYPQFNNALKIEVGLWFCGCVLDQVGSLYLDIASRFRFVASRAWHSFLCASLSLPSMKVAWKQQNMTMRLAQCGDKASSAQGRQSTENT